MLTFKILYYLFAFFKKIFFKLIYGNKFIFGNNLIFRKNFSLMISSKGQVIIGNNCFFNNFCSLNCLKKIEIGDGSIFGEGVKIYDHNHKFCDLELPIKEQGFSVAEVKIGNHCWIGSNVVILKGSIIEDNCVIGAGCIISGRIKSGHIIKSKNIYIAEKIECK
ncbi:acyltransferase [Succinivibrio dextrinosolvens]|uniref:acyltransferase n=1 Tax=Succinivibrio dextrinosolvens TaxID=83771 RepID=UPI00068FEE26|nr:acyltransferase [Succinivibrio dextrinosolvens]